MSNRSSVEEAPSTELRKNVEKQNKTKLFQELDVAFWELKNKNSHLIFIFGLVTDDARVV